MRTPVLFRAALLALAACGGPHAAGDALSTLSGGPDSPVGPTTPCTMTRVVDGDTVDCEPVGRVRLLGMDTPEPAQAPFGARATAELARLAPPGTGILFEADVQRRDRYGRELGYLWREVEGRRVQLNWALVRRGYALVLTYPPNVQWTDSLVAAQLAAREEGSGLWADGGFACPPVDFRGRRCGR